MGPVPSIGRKFSATRKVRLGDVDPGGCFRLDALTRYTQDVSSDDTTDAELDESTAWVVRKTEVRVHHHAVLAEELSLTTFCGGLGRRWAERRIQVLGSAGAHYEVATLWIHIDPVRLRPLGLTDQFLEIYGPAAGDRTVGASLVLPKSDGSGTRESWPTRAVDFDTQRHMNNAAYWAVIEERLTDDRRPPSFRAIIEYGAGINSGHSVELEAVDAIDPLTEEWGTTVWWHASDPDGSEAFVAATARIELC